MRGSRRRSQSRSKCRKAFTRETLVVCLRSLWVKGAIQDIIEAPACVFDKSNRCDPVSVGNLEADASVRDALPAFFPS